MPRHRSIAALLFVLQATAAIGQAHTKTDGGGKDVSVALFSAHPAYQVTITPIGASSWTAICATCPHVELSKPLTLAPKTELYAGGTLRVTDATTHDSRIAAGLWHLRSTKQGEPIDVVLTLPSERYVAAVLNAEAAHDEPTESLRALAIVARTYALNGRHYTAQPGHLDAELCDSTQCQAMSLQPSSSAIEAATRDTAGETLWYGSHRAEVYFSQSCGGLTEDASTVWPKLKGLPYLRSHADPFCERRVNSAWHAQVSLPNLLQIAKSEGWHLPAGIADTRVTQRSASHRALRIAFLGRDGTSTTISATALRFGIGRTLGWNLVRSDNYEFTLQGGTLNFTGRGHGHGVGLCQVGAAEMAAEGKTAADILSFYFPGTTVRITTADEGWKNLRTQSLTIRSTQALSAQQQAAVEQLWKDVQYTFPPVHPVTPTITFAPTTEIFRQLTNEPGWTLASTQGTTIVLQPPSVFHAPMSSQQQTLRHEMLHIAVETACTERTPLWLREGMVEVLSGEKLRPVTSMALPEIESSLHHPASLQESDRAHMAAATKVQSLINRYGAGTVRGWLSTGVPPGVSDR